MQPIEAAWAVLKNDEMSYEGPHAGITWYQLGYSWGEADIDPYQVEKQIVKQYLHGSLYPNDDPASAEWKAYEQWSKHVAGEMQDGYWDAINAQRKVEDDEEEAGKFLGEEFDPNDPEHTGHGQGDF